MTLKWTFYSCILALLLFNIYSVNCDWKDGQCPMAPVVPDDKMDGYCINNTNIKIEPASNAEWSVLSIQHMCCQNNGGNHNVFLYLQDKEGNRVPYQFGVGPIADVQGTGISDSTAPCDKNEKFGPPSFAVPISASIPMYANVHSYCVSIQTSNKSSDKVCGLTTRLADQCSQNTFGHHSFYIIYQKN